MDEKLAQLEQWGADIDGARERFLGDETLYKDCLDTFLGDGGFEDLNQALTDQDYHRAFDAVHTLKGVAGNLGLNPLFQVCSDLTEDLRADRYDRVEPLYAAVVEKNDEFKKIMKA